MATKKYKGGGGPDDPHIANKASLYKRLLDKGIIDNTIDENTFYSLPKEEIDGYFKKYGEVIGAKTQEEVDAMPGTKIYLTPTIFTGKVESTNNFDSAFAEARKSGLNSFVYEGKTYTTDIATSGGAKTTNSNQIKKEDYVANLVNKEMGLGGSVGAALGAASFLIPGVGPAISPILTPLLSGLGNQIDAKNSASDLNPTKTVATSSTNPTGNYKEGGKAPENLKPLEGGYFSKLSDGIFIAKGNTHKQGGIEGDVDGDNQPEIEFEKGELYFDKEDYIISAENSNKFKSSFSKRDDKVAKTTNALLKDLAIKTNETTLKAKDGGHFSMYAGGGGVGSGPVQYNFWETQPVTPYGIEDAMFNLSEMYGSVQNPSIKQTATGNNPKVMSSSNTGLMSGFNIPTADNLTKDGLTPKVNAKTTEATSMGLTTGDKLNIAGQLIPAAYNLSRGLFEKAETVTPYVHPYADKIKSIMGNRSYNPATVQREIDYATAAGKEGIVENTTSASVTRSNFQSLYDTMARNKAKADLEGQQMNNQYKSEYAQTLDSLGRFEVAASEAADAATWQNKVAKDDYISTGVTQVGSAVNTIGAGLNQNATNNMLFNILGEVAQNYTIDKNGKIVFK